MKTQTKIKHETASEFAMRLENLCNEVDTQDFYEPSLHMTTASDGRQTGTLRWTKYIQTPEESEIAQRMQRMLSPDVPQKLKKVSMWRRFTCWLRSVWSRHAEPVGAC